jgi:glutamate-1-semialdehyde aminotransferase
MTSKNLWRGGASLSAELHYGEPLVITHAKGASVFDIDGKSTSTSAASW